MSSGFGLNRKNFWAADKPRFGGVFFLRTPLAWMSPDAEFMSYQNYQHDEYLLSNQRIASRLYADEIA